MAEFVPFRALRFHSEHLGARVAPPYDVLSEAQVRELRSRGDIEITRLDVPLVDGSDDPYASAAALLSEWVATNELSVDERPSFTICRMSFIDALGHERRIDGVIGALEVVDEGEGRVLPHERTTPKASTDRLDLTRSTRANLSPVWGLSLGKGLTSLLAEPGELVGEVDWDGVIHRFERVTEDDRVAAITECLRGSDVLIADGHHRYGVARHFRDEVRSRTGQSNTDAEYTMAFVNELVEDQLAIAAIHRLYRTDDVEGFVASLLRSYEEVAAGPVGTPTLEDMNRLGCVCLVRRDGSGTMLRPRTDAFGGVRDLDGLRLETAIVGVDHRVEYQHGVDEVLNALSEGRADLAVLIRPVAIGEIRATGEQGELMPPKSTFFTPKLLTGPVIRPMSDL